MDFSAEQQDLDLKAGTPFERLRARVLDGWNVQADLRDSWANAWDFYDGGGQLWWQSKLPADLRDDAVITNFTFASVEQYVATLMQDEPDWYVVAEDAERDAYAQQATSYLQAFAQVANVNAERESIYRHALIGGNGVALVYWDELAGPKDEAGNPQGDAAVRAFDPAAVVIDPTATRLVEAEFVALRHVYGYRRAALLFAKIPADPSASGAEGLEIIGHDNEVETEDDEARESAQERVVVWEVYHDFGAKRTIYSGSKLLHEGDNPIPNGRFPIVLFPLYPVRYRLWADGLVAQMKPLQDLFNKLRTRVAIWARYVANPVVVAIGPQGEIQTAPGSVIKVLSGGDVKYLRPPDMPADVFRSLESLPADMDVITGVHEITRGIRPVGTTSGISLEVLHHAAQTRLTGPARAWTAAWSEVGQRLLELMQKHYTGTRSLATVQGGEVGRVAVAPEALSAVVPDRAEGAAEGAMQVRAHRYRVVTQPKGDLPLSPAAMSELSLQLINTMAEDGRPVIDRTALLDNLRYPGRQQLMERIMMQGQAQMEGEADALAALHGQMGAQAEAAAGQEQALAGAEVAAAADELVRGQAQLGMEQLTGALERMLTPQQLEIVQGVVEGRVPPAALGRVAASLPEEGRELLSYYVEAAAQDAQLTGGAAV